MAVEVIKIFSEYQTECSTVRDLTEALDEVYEGQETILIDLDKSMRFNYNIRGVLEEAVEIKYVEADTFDDDSD
jgi:hypothetical protein